MKNWKELSELERLLYRELLKRDAYFFCQEFWSEIETSKFVKSDYLQFMAEVFQYQCRYWIQIKEIDVTLPKLKKNEVIVDIRNNKYLTSISCPPRHTKSSFINILLPCWAFVNVPLKIASVSHTQGLAGTMNYKRQKLLNSEKFRYFFPEIKLIQNTTYSLKDSRGGELYSVPKNSITGFGADILLIDDLTNVFQAVRDMQEMESSWTTYTEVLPSRINDPQKHAIINIMQRIAVNDIVGRILKDPKLSESYNFIVLPAQFREKTYLICPISGKIITFEKGSYLFPERYGDYSIIKARVNEHTWKAQYLQEPENSDLSVISQDMIIEKSEKEVPSMEMADIVYSSHDFPVKDKETSDFLGSVLAYRVGSTLYIADCLEKRMAFVKSIEYVKQLDSVFPGIIQIIEDKANGSPILQQLQDEVAGMQAFQPGTASKMQRLESASLYMNSKNVVFVKTEFDEISKLYRLSNNLQNLKDRLLSFPFVEHDDIVDAFSMLILFVFMDKKYAVYGRSFNEDNIINALSEQITYSTVFFNREGDLWKILEIGIQYSKETKLIVKKEYRFRGSIDDGISVLKKFTPNKKVFIDCSASEALSGTYHQKINIERYAIDDFDKSVLELNLAFDKNKVLIDERCLYTKAEIENFKFAKTKDETVKYVSEKDGFIACLRIAMKYYGGIV